MLDLPLPVEFREEIVRKLLMSLRQGGSCSLIGVGSSGKSNIARHIDRMDVREYYLDDYAQYVLSLYVNCAKLTKAEYSARSLHCLILEVMMKTVRESESGVAAHYSEFRVLWKEAIESESDALARSNLEDAFGTVFRAGIKQAYVILDDFDNFFVEAPAPALNSLRALRDDYKGKIMYVTITRHELGYMRDPTEVEDFLELVAPATTIAAGPYSEDDARFMIQRLAARETPPRTFSRLEEDRVLELSGRHPGLIRMVYTVTQGQLPLMSSSLPERLRNHPAIVEECEKIWASLEKSERDDLKAVVCEHKLTKEEARALWGKGIIQPRSDGTYAVFSPVFEDFVADLLKRQLPIQSLPDQQFKVDNQIIEGLSGIEYHLLSCLVREYPKPVSRGQLLKEMFTAEAGQPQTGGSPERRLDTYFNGIKRRIEFGDQQYIVPLEDRRYRLLKCSR